MPLHRCYMSQPNLRQAYDLHCPNWESGSFRADTAGILRLVPRALL
jgi:hypothetical protein